MLSRACVLMQRMEKNIFLGGLHNSSACKNRLSHVATLRGPLAKIDYRMWLGCPHAKILIFANTCVWTGHLSAYKDLFFVERLAPDNVKFILILIEHKKNYKIKTLGGCNQKNEEKKPPPHAPTTPEHISGRRLAPDRSPLCVTCRC